MDFSEVLNKAWKIVWKFKILWIFGIFAGCARGGGGSGNSGFRMGGSGTSGSAPMPPGITNGFERILGLFANPAVIAVFIIAILIIILLSVFFSIMGRIGLIKGALDADGGAEHLSFSDLWKSGLHFFWRILGLSLLIGSPVILFYLILITAAVIVLLMYLSGLPNSSFAAAAPGFLAFIPVICLLGCTVILLAVIISFLSPQAERAIVIENEGVISGLRRGWQVLTKNLGSILIIWLIMLAITFVVGIVIALPLLIDLIPAIVAFLAGGSHPSFTPLIIAGLCFVAYIPIAVVANGILTAYLESVWTLTYLRLTKSTLEPATPLTLLTNP